MILKKAPITKMERRARTSEPKAVTSAVMSPEAYGIAVRICDLDMSYPMP